MFALFIDRHADMFVVACSRFFLLSAAHRRYAGKHVKIDSSGTTKSRHFVHQKVHRRENRKNPCDLIGFATHFQSYTLNMNFIESAWENELLGFAYFLLVGDNSIKHLKAFHSVY